MLGETGQKIQEAGFGNAMRRAPWWVYLIAAVGSWSSCSHRLALVLKTPWDTFVAQVTSQSSREALRLSLQTSAATTGLCVLLGVPMAVVLFAARRPARAGTSVAGAAALVPPPVVGGPRCCTRSVLGILDSRCVRRNRYRLHHYRRDSRANLGAAVLVISVEGALRSAGTRYEEVAATLGASPTRVLGKVTILLIAPSVLAGWCCRSRGRSASSAPPSPSPATLRRHPDRALAIYVDAMTTPNGPSHVHCAGTDFAGRRGQGTAVVGGGSDRGERFGSLIIAGPSS